MLLKTVRPRGRDRRPPLHRLPTLVLAWRGLLGGPLLPALMISLLASDLPQDRVEQVAEHLLKIGFVLGTVAKDLAGDGLLTKVAAELAEPENSGAAYRATHQGH